MIYKYSTVVAQGFDALNANMYAQYEAIRVTQPGFIIDLHDIVVTHEGKTQSVHVVTQSVVIWALVKSHLNMGVLRNNGREMSKSTFPFFLPQSVDA